LWQTRDHLTRLGGEADSSAPSAEISALAQMAIRKPFMARMVANSSRGNCPLLYTALFTALEMIPQTSFSACHKMFINKWLQRENCLPTPLANNLGKPPVAGLAVGTSSPVPGPLPPWRRGGA
jgi:hypothetical protein